MKRHPRGLVFKLVTSTAAFMHGAGDTAELRANGFEAAARYWFRALAGPSLPRPCARFEPGCHCLRCEEGRVFGSADHGRGVSFILRSQQLRSALISMLPHHPQNSRLPRNAIAAGQALELHIIPALPTCEPSRTRAAAASLLVASMLGGVGQRSRRGAGSMTILEIEGDPGLGAEAASVIACEDAASWGRSLARLIKVSRDVVLGAVVRSTPQTSSPPPFPMLVSTPDTRIVVVALDAKTEESARADVMKRLQPFKNAAFGLPYMKAAAGDRPLNGRHASPLWIHLQPSKGRFIAVFTVMRSSSMVRQASWARMDAALDSLDGVAVSA